jgi:uncharacterized protein with HEPN domain
VKDDKLYLIYILECISRIEKFTAGGREEFMDSDLIQDAVLRNLHTLSESTQRLSDRLKAAYPQIPWEDISGFRNVLVHDYMMIDLPRIWRIVQHNLPDLKHQAQEMLADLGGVERLL